MTANETKTPYEFLAWDSEFFGKKIARVNARTLKRESLPELVDYARRTESDCVYFLADSNDPETHFLAAELGFRLVDSRVKYERAMDIALPAEQPPKTRAIIRSHTPADIPILETFSLGLFEQSRFYTDPGFERDACDRLYSTWIRKSCMGWAQRVTIAEMEGAPVGYVTCHLDEGGALGRIGLIATAPEAQGSGIGNLLLSKSLQWFEEQGAERVEVVTQGANLRAQHVYQRHGFVTKAVELWYHWWPQGN